MRDILDPFFTIEEVEVPRTGVDPETGEPIDLEPELVPYIHFEC